jgi:hypothetical protein
VPIIPIFTANDHPTADTTNTSENGSANGQENIQNDGENTTIEEDISCMGSEVNSD